MKRKKKRKRCTMKKDKERFMKEKGERKKSSKEEGKERVI